MTANKFTKEVPVPELGAGYKLRIGMNAFAAIEMEYAREDQLSGTQEYWSRVASLLETGSPMAVMFVVGVGLCDGDGKRVEDFDLDEAFNTNPELTIDVLAKHCLDALSLGRFGKTFEDLLIEVAEREAKGREAKEAENPPKSPDTGSNG
jgi:hypothetical protein